MFEICKDRNFISAKKEDIRRLMISLNEPVVAPSNYSAQRSQAYMAALKNGQEFAVFTCLYLTLERTGILYRYTDSIKSDKECRAAEEEGLYFMETMGFIVDDSNFESLEKSEQERLLASIPLFTPPAKVVEQVVEEKNEKEDIAVKEEVVSEAIAAVTEAIKVEEKPAMEEKVRAEKGVAEEPAESEGRWVPELSLSKFRIRAAAERVTKNY